MLADPGDRGGGAANGFHSSGVEVFGLGMLRDWAPPEDAATKCWKRSRECEGAGCLDYHTHRARFEFAADGLVMPEGCRGMYPGGETFVAWGDEPR